MASKYTLIWYTNHQWIKSKISHWQFRLNWLRNPFDIWSIPPGVQLCSVGGVVEQQMEKMGLHYWTLKANKEDILEVAKIQGKKLIYLSPEADKPL